MDTNPTRQRGNLTLWVVMILFAPQAFVPTAAVAQEPAAQATALAIERLLVEAVERAEKSVVAIARVRKSATPDTPAPAAPPPAIPGLGVSDPTDPAFIPNEFGTGVVFDGSGLLLTNYHVVGDFRTADYYVWHDRKPYSAKLKAADPWLDMAVLQVATDQLKPVTLGDARNLKKGQFVIALGNPYAIARDGRPSAAFGIVSNQERQAPVPASGNRSNQEGRETLHHWGTLIQTDAKLELGTSGGALVNLKGEMIGLTTSLAALYGYERAGGFAIPVNDEFRRALDTLRNGKLPDYGFLGVAPRSLTMTERQRGRFGARVEDVVPATPAATAGLKGGDIITAANSQKIADELDLIRYVSGQFADAIVNLQILRGASESRAGRTQQVSVKLSKKRQEGPRAGFAEVAAESWRGMQVEYATASPMFRELSRDLDPAGCVGVIEVVRESPCWLAGFRAGDFISQVGPTSVATPREFYDVTASLTGEVTLKLSAARSDRTTRTVAASP